jgi:hypothetical protein
MIKLRIEVGGVSQEREFSGDVLAIGRASDNAVVVGDRKVSRKHARIEKVGAEVRLVHVAEGNRTRVNGQEVQARALAAGDRIELGESALVVLDLGGPPVPMPSLLPPPAAPAAPEEETDCRPVPRPAMPGPGRSSARRVVAGLAVAGALVALAWGAWVVMERHGRIAPPAPRRAAKEERKGPSLQEAEVALAALRAEAGSVKVVGEDLVARAEELTRKHGPAYPEHAYGTATPFDRFLTELRERRAPRAAAKPEESKAREETPPPPPRAVERPVARVEPAAPPSPAVPEVRPAAVEAPKEPPRPEVPPPAVPGLRVASVSARGDPTRVTVVFSRPVDKASAETAANYAVEPGVKVTAAARSAMDFRVVTLTVMPMVEEKPYALSVKDVKDCAPAPAAVPLGAGGTFSFVRGILSGTAREEGEAAAGSGRRVNHAGRPLPPMPRFKEPLMFNTPEADAVLSAMQVFPPNNPWNEDVSKLPVHPNSDKFIASVGDEKPFRENWDMCFVLVPPNQPRVEVKLLTYADESDKGPYPVPDNGPIEGWPMSGGTLENIQRRGDGDRHLIVVDPLNLMLYEFYQGRRADAGWEASNEATFSLAGNKLRPRGWTSSDAAGLPIFPSIPRYDECERGMVEHAMRFTVRRTRREFIYPATHQAGHTPDPNVPAMGQRFRLKAGVDVSGFPKHARAIALGLKKYGMFVADNGSDWYLSVPPDRRLEGLDALRRLKGIDFEVVATTGENEGPRAGGRP